MKKYLILSCIVVGLGALAISGCSKDSVTGPQISTDTQALQYMVTNSDSVAAFSAASIYSIDDNGMRPPDYDGLLKLGVVPDVAHSILSDSSHPLRWGRHIFWDQIVADYHVEKSGDTLAKVDVKRTIPGEFWVGWGTRIAPDSVVLDTVVKKPFTEVAQHSVVFRRIARSFEPLHNWFPVAMTMVKGESQGTKLFNVSSLEVKDLSGTFDTTVTDPLSTWFRFGFGRGHIPLFHVHDSLLVRVTVNSSDDSAEVVYLRRDIGGLGLDQRRSRMELISTTGGAGSYIRTYEKTFVTGLRPMEMAERLHGAIDVFSRGTIFDMAAPFANEFWGVPYVVARY